MMSSQNDIIISLYRQSKTVFTLAEIAMMTDADGDSSLAARLNYQVRKGRLLNIRKGVYAKPGYKVEEAAAVLYTPAYLSLEYVLQQSGIVFQYDERITMVSYLNRTVRIGDREIVYRQVKGGILAATEGVELKGTVSTATTERAFLDVMYLNSSYHFDNLRPLDKRKILELLPLYGNKTMETRVKKMLDAL